MDIIELFEKTSGIKLKWYQKAYLKALQQGQKVTFPKQLGRKQYLEFMKEFNEKFTN